MDWLLFTKVIAAFAGIVGIGKILLELANRKKTNLREEYKFAKEFLDNKENNKLHPFILDKGYQAIAGTHTVKAKEVEYLMSLENPIQCLKDYIYSKSLLENLQLEEHSSVKFKEKFKSDFARQWRKAFYFTSYFVMSFLALSPMLLSNIVFEKAADSILLLSFTVPFGGLYAWLAVKAYTKIKQAESLVSNQKQHTQNILCSKDS